MSCPVAVAAALRPWALVARPGAAGAAQAYRHWLAVFRRLARRAGGDDARLLALLASCLSQDNFRLVSGAASYPEACNALEVAFASASQGEDAGQLAEEISMKNEIQKELEEEVQKKSEINVSLDEKIAHLRSLINQKENCSVSELKERIELTKQSIGRNMDTDFDKLELDMMAKEAKVSSLENELDKLKISEKQLAVEKEDLEKRLKESKQKIKQMREQKEQAEKEMAELRQTGILEITSMEGVIKACADLVKNLMYICKIYVKLPKDIPCHNSPELNKLFDLLREHFKGFLWIELQHSFVNYIPCDELIVQLHGSRVQVARFIGCLSDDVATVVLYNLAADGVRVSVSLKDPLKNHHLNRLRDIPWLGVYVPVNVPLRPRPPACPLPRGVGLLKLQLCGVTRASRTKAQHLLCALAPQNKCFTEILVETGDLGEGQISELFNAARKAGLKTTTEAAGPGWGKLLPDSSVYLSVSGGNIYCFMLPADPALANMPPLANPIVSSYDIKFEQKCKCPRHHIYM